MEKGKGEGKNWRETHTQRETHARGMSEKGMKEGITHTHTHAHTCTHAPNRKHESGETRIEEEHTRKKKKNTKKRGGSKRGIPAH